MEPQAWFSAHCNLPRNRMYHPLLQSPPKSCFTTASCSQNQTPLSRRLVPAEVSSSPDNNTYRRARLGSTSAAFPTIV
jgi:hypothetical protein